MSIEEPLLTIKRIYVLLVDDHQVVIEETHKETVSRKLQGADITRHGTPENPAFLIVQANGDRVLKLKSEVKSA